MTYDKVDVAWAAELYEGEGTINARYGTFVTKSGERRNRKSPVYQLKVAMTDLEPLERFRDTFGIGKIYGPYDGPGRTKLIWQYSVSSFEGTQAIIAALWPHLSPRRREQAAGALTIGENNPIR